MSEKSGRGVIETPVRNGVVEPGRVVVDGLTQKSPRRGVMGLIPFVVRVPTPEWSCTPGGLGEVMVPRVESVDPSPVPEETDMVLSPRHTYLLLPPVPDPFVSVRGSENALTVVWVLWSVYHGNQYTTSNSVTESFRLSFLHPSHPPSVPLQQVESTGRCRSPRSGWTTKFTQGVVFYTEETEEESGRNWRRESVVPTGRSGLVPSRLLPFCRDVKEKEDVPLWVHPR